MIMNIDKDRSKFIQSEVEKRLVPGFFTVSVSHTTYEHEIIISDGTSSACHRLSYGELVNPSFEHMLDKITQNLVRIFAAERFIRK